METQPGRHAQDALRLVESARYALLRRLAFAMRHHMVVNLQPIGMVSEVLERRMKSPAPDLGLIQEGMAKINGFSRAAVQSCLDVVTWLAPEPGSVTPLDAGVHESLAMLRSNFSFRGFELRNEVGAAPQEVARASLRSVLPACLLALTDHVEAPAEVVVSLESAATLLVRVQRTGGSAGFPGEAPYRLLDWAEVEALAADEGVALAREGGDARITLPAAQA